MSRHFTATILLERPWPLDIDALACAVRTQFPQIGTIEAVPGQAGDRDTGVLTLDGAQIVIQSHDRGSHDEMRPPLKTLKVWDPSRALRRHRARLSISCGGSMPGLLGAKAYAAATHFVTAAAIDLVPAQAVFWQHGWTVSRPVDFVEATFGLADGRMPIGSWISFAPVVPRGYQPAEAMGMVSYGLRPMIGRELELAPRPGDPESAYACLSDIVRRLLDGGLTVRDGMRLGTGNGIELTVRARTYWLRRNESAYVLVADDSVVDRETLRPQERKAA